MHIIMIQVGHQLYDHKITLNILQQNCDHVEDAQCNYMKMTENQKICPYHLDVDWFNYNCFCAVQHVTRFDLFTYQYVGIICPYHLDVDWFNYNGFHAVQHVTCFNLFTYQYFGIVFDCQIIFNCENEPVHFDQSIYGHMHHKHNSAGNCVSDGFNDKQLNKSVNYNESID